MILRHEKIPTDGQPPENTFELIDEHTGEIINSSVIYTDNNARMFPIRPFQVRVAFESTPVPDMLLGATIARAQKVCMESGAFSRLFTHCNPDDDVFMKSLEPFGLEDSDGLLRMQLRLPYDGVVKKPSGCALVYDKLEDETEQQYFLERYNELFNTRHTREWLLDFIARDDFTRIVTVSSNGIAGEVLCWREDNCGVIGFIQTSKKWRRLGVATYMLSMACQRFDDYELYCAEINVRARYPHVLKMLTKFGFEQTDVLMRYPGIDINPET